MPPVVPPFLIGLVVAPLAKRLIKPLMRGVVKTSVGLVLEVKKAAHEAGENIHDLATEVAAEVVAAQLSAEADAAPAAETRRPAGTVVTHGGKDEAGGARGEGDARASKIRPTAGAVKTH